ncbi:TetR/AcrR family transcriptional regulator [Nocardioides marmorisolisilvae]|uniref:TetR/AcrR family transcriptional regulator n=1 Tax=Nocardioides marmorisolisilvae TaxID=1542737 RepID=A0A3N0DRL7_9ACTN|nr:TetR/AcrR family transcriptional regulator [Nocardioides marmorisolisilvae]RNL78275.1 TetR/AcrR family transcriptional regulator [Nocardioides marmorisolisilvae]
MARPQVVDIDALLDHARGIWVAEGQAGVTIRALSAASGVSNGAIYHHFSSRTHLLAQIWAREAASFRLFQRERIQEARDAGTAEDAVVAAALATGAYAEVKGAAVRVLFGSRPDSLTAEGVPDEVIKELRRHRASAATLIADLAEEVWGRSDKDAKRLMRNCVVDIPARIFMAADKPNDKLARYAIEHAVRGLLAAGPPD